MAVVAGVDDSPMAGEVVRRAMEQAKWRNTDLHLVHVFHPPVVYLEVPIDLTEVATAQRSLVWQALESSISNSDIAVSKVDLEGYPPDTLVDYANEMKADLLVLGTRGRGELASLILGSTSHRAIQLAQCDVLVVKPVPA